MKKNYIAPSVQIAEAVSANIMDASLSVNSTKTVDTAYSKHIDIWQSEDEEDE